LEGYLPIVVAQDERAGLGYEQTAFGWSPGMGPVSLAIDSRSDEGTILATVDPPVRTPPEAIALRLRHPRGDSIRSVRVDGRPSTEFTADTVTLRGLTARAAIEVRYRP